MITDQLIAWVLYLVACTGLVVIFWRLTRGLHRVLKRSLRVVVASLLFTPYAMTADNAWLAPAYLVAGYEAAKGNSDTAGSALLAIIAFIAFMTLLVFLESVFRRISGLDKA